MKVAIIGAGASGLCCARQFSRFPQMFEIQVFEQTAGVGGTWVYTDDTDTDEMGLPIHSSMYRSMRTNLPKEIMCFRDYPFQPNDPYTSFVPHWAVLRYLQQYTTHYQLNRFIRFRTLVELVVPCTANHNNQGFSEESNGASSDESKQKTSIGFHDDTSWLVTSRDLVSGHRTTESYDAVLVCNGHYFKPYFPTDIPGLDKFPGRIVHSHRYREPTLYQNERVLVVGAGQSGLDIALDLATHTQTVYLSNRNAWITCALPGNIEQVPSVKAIGSDGIVCFTNGVQRPVDTILLCTGYHYEFPFLRRDSGIHVENRRIVRLYKHTFNVVHPSMAFIGFNLRILPFPLFDLQTLWVLAVWSDKKHLPSREEMAADSDSDYRKRLENGYPPHYAHHLGSLQWAFRKELADLAGVEPYPPVVQKLYEERYRTQRADLCHYKDLNYAIVNEDEWTMVTPDQR